MPDSNITPGPWEVTKAKHGIDGGHYEVAVVACERDDRSLVIHAEQGDDSQGDANAKAIAAVPKMVEALLSARKALRLSVQSFPGIERQVDEALKLAGIEL
jgi:hypothetical protein